MSRLGRSIGNKNLYDGKIAGLYDLEETLGRGHFAVVKLARHVFTGEKVAVKVIDKTKLDEVSKAHLFQEVRCMKLVQHPNVVRLYEVIDTQTKLYLILELGDGGDMYDYIMRHEQGVDENVARKYFRQIVQAISYCHRLHVVHRDLKPENVVFFEKLGMVKLTDFGFSNKFCPGQKLETSCGSLAYSAPEILLGDSYDAPAVDVWSLGVILYMLVCGQAPFQEANDSETLTMIMDCKYTIPEHVTFHCQRLIEKMLIRDPSQRATLTDIAQDMWVMEGSVLQLSDYLPLVSREHLSEEDHTYILQKMVTGSIALKEEILEALDRNEYNHITATYFLLAERKLRTQRQEQAQKLSQGMTSKTLAIGAPPSPSPLGLSPRVAEDCDGPITHGSMDNLLTQGGTRDTQKQISHQQSVPQPSSPENNKGARRSSRPKSLDIPSLQQNQEPSSKKVSFLSGRLVTCSPCTPSSRGTPKTPFRTLPSPNRRLHSVKSSPQLTLNEIFEEAESDVDSQDLSSGAIGSVGSQTKQESPNKRFEQRRRLSKNRTASCSSSDASDDDQETRKRKVNKIKSLQRRDSHDDSSDSQDPGDGSGGVGGHLSRADSHGKTQSSSQNQQQGGNQDTTGNKGGQCPRSRRYHRLRESQSLNRISELHTIEIKEEEEAEVSSPERRTRIILSNKCIVDVNQNGLSVNANGHSLLLIAPNSRCCSLC